MGKHKNPFAMPFAGREQSHLKQFLLKLFEDGCPPEEAVRSLRTRVDAGDFAKARATGRKFDGPIAADARGPRGKN